MSAARPTRFPAPRSRRLITGWNRSSTTSTARGARLAREAAQLAERQDGRRRFVAGAIGPTNRTLSISPDVNNPGYRAVTFDQVKTAYREQVRGLIAGGAELILIETVFDTLNAKAAVAACWAVFDETGIRLPIQISGTITDLSGRTLSGQTPEAFWNALRHSDPLTLRPQLRARRPRNARPHRRAVAAVRHPGLRLSECRPAQRVRPLRREPGGHGRAGRRVRRGAASSTWSAAAAAPRRTTSALSRRRSPSTSPGRSRRCRG